MTELLEADAVQHLLHLGHVGSHGHGALATLVVGSVTTQVLAHCKVPLLIVR